MKFGRVGDVFSWCLGLVLRCSKISCEHICILMPKKKNSRIYMDMGVTLQKIEKIEDSASVIKKRLEEEAGTKPLAYGSIKVSELAELLGGSAREPFFIGSGWGDIAGDGIDPTDPKAVACALETGARANTRVRAYGAVITLPKGASLVSAFDLEDPESIQKLLRNMLDEYMRVLEKDCVVRFGNGGHEQVPVRGLKAWAVVHAASAGGDPHYHVHVIVSATAETIDGRKGQLDGDKLLGETARLADGSAKRVMSQRLEELGFGIGLDGDVVGVDKGIIERASTARNSVQAIRTYLAAKGINVSDKTAWAHWRQVAEGKPDKSLSASLVNGIGMARGEKLGGEAIEHAIDEALSNPKRRAALRDWFAQKYAISDWRTFGDKARAEWKKYPRYDDVTKVVALMAMLPTPPTPASVEGLCARFADDKHRAELMEKVGNDPRVLKGNRRWALTSQLIRERKIAEQTEKLIPRDCCDQGIEELLVDTELPLVVIQGVAGAGKSRALQAASKERKNKGATVWATARNRLTAVETGSAAGAKRSHALSSYALREAVARSKGPKSGDILIVDETGLLDHGDVEMILSLAENGVIVKLLGDSHQIQPIDSSTSARLVMDIAKKHDMPALDYTWRCEPWKELHDALREVVTGAADPKEVIEHLEIHFAETPDDVVKIAKSHEGAEIAVQSNELRCEIAEQLPRPNRPKHLRQVFMTRDETAAWAGDHVVIRKNIAAKSRSGESIWLYNGQTARVAQVSRTEVVLLTDTDLLKISAETAKEALSLRGVWTGDSAQGQTWDRSIVVLTGLETRKWLYSAATRGRNAPVLVVLSGDGEDARSIVEAVLSREGIAQTVDEMCKTDPLLAKSVREAEAAWAGSQDRTGSKTAGESKPEQLLLPLEETPEKEDLRNKTSGEKVSVNAFPQPRRYLGGFFYLEEGGEWQVDFEKRQELYRLARKTAGLGNSWGGKSREAKVAEPFRVDSRREIMPGSREFYDPALDPSNEAYLPGLAKELQDRQCDRSGRVYKGGFFYKGDEGIWLVDFKKREEAKSEAENLPLKHEDPKLWRSVAAKIFDISHRRPVEHGKETGIYDPGLDDYGVALQAAKKAKAEMVQVEAAADLEAEGKLSVSQTYKNGVEEKLHGQREPAPEPDSSDDASGPDRGVKPAAGSYRMRL